MLVLNFGKLFGTVLLRTVILFVIDRFSSTDVFADQPLLEHNK